MQEDQEPVTQSISNPVNQKPNSFLVILLSSLLLISCVIAGFFAYQTQRLVVEVDGYREQFKLISTPLNTNSPKPSEESSKIETCVKCVDKEYKMSFEVPEGYICEINNPESKYGLFDRSYSITKKVENPERLTTYIEIMVFPNKYDFQQFPVGQHIADLYIGYHEFFKNMNIGETKLYKKGDIEEEDKKYWTYTRSSDIKIAGENAMVLFNNYVYEGREGEIQKLHFIKHGDLIYSIRAYLYSSPIDINQETLDQILSTFKFLDK